MKNAAVIFPSALGRYQPPRRWEVGNLKTSIRRKIPFVETAQRRCAPGSTLSSWPGKEFERSEIQVNGFPQEMMRNLRTESRKKNRVNAVKWQILILRSVRYFFP